MEALSSPLSNWTQRSFPPLGQQPSVKREAKLLTVTLNVQPFERLLLFGQRNAENHNTQTEPSVTTESRLAQWENRETPDAHVYYKTVYTFVQKKRDKSINVQSFTKASQLFNVTGSKEAKESHAKFSIHLNFLKVGSTGLKREPIWLPCKNYHRLHACWPNKTKRNKNNTILVFLCTKWSVQCITLIGVTYPHAQLVPRQDHAGNPMTTTRPSPSVTGRRSQSYGRQQQPGKLQDRLINRHVDRANQKLEQRRARSWPRAQTTSMQILAWTVRR